MILQEVVEEKIPGYVVRRSSDYGVMNVGYFEITHTPQQQPPQQTAPMTVSSGQPTSQESIK